MIQALVNNCVYLPSSRFPGAWEENFSVSDFADGVLSGDPVREQGKQDREEEVKQGQV